MTTSLSARILAAAFLLLFLLSSSLFAQNIPLAEHPRPDFERSQWQNLNGFWAFEFDANDEGMDANWANGKKTFSRRIQVPFPWGSELSGQKDEADIAWY